MRANGFFSSAAPGAASGHDILRGAGEPVIGGDCFADTRYRGAMPDSHSTHEGMAGGVAVPWTVWTAEQKPA